MLTGEENERMTSIGPGTPMGELMRRYWHPIAASSELATFGTRPITLLGESLVLYRDRSGTLGLVAGRCPHRSAGMVFGIPEEHGLRCAYHGWCFDETGRCTDQPYETTEDPTSTFRDRTPIQSYPVEELGGLIFAYLGPGPTPLLPRWDLLVMEGVNRDIGRTIVPCNWLQVMENSFDPVHVEWLHTYFSNYVLERLGRPDLRRWTRNTDAEGRPLPRYRHKKIGFSEFEHGIIKRRIIEGTDESHELWAIGHPVIFPLLLRTGYTLQYRVPMDDQRTLYFYYNCYPPKPGIEVKDQQESEIPVYDVPIAGMDEKGEPQWSLLDNNSGQDIAMWFTQGRISDRSREHLGLSDRGVILYRQQLKDNLAKVLEGEDPMNTFRDPEQNVCIVFDNEYQHRTDRADDVSRVVAASKYSPILKKAVVRTKGGEAAEEPVH